MAANPDDILIQRLEQTVDTWNAEVTAAHEKLARQIGDARAQLRSLVDILDARTGPPSQSRGAIRSRALEQRDEALSEATDRVHALELRLQQLDRERTDMRRELADARTRSAELEAEIEAYRDQESVGAQMLEAAQKELDTLKTSMRETTDARESARREIDILRRELETLQAERDDDARREQARSDTADRTQHVGKLEQEIDSLTHGLTSVREELEAERERRAELEAELDTAGAELEVRAHELSAERARRAELEADLQTAEQELDERARELAETRRQRDDLQATSRKLENVLAAALEDNERHAQTLQSFEQELAQLRQTRTDPAQEAALREEAETLRKTVESLRQSESDLQRQLASINSEYDRQAEKLAETVRELEAHWDLETKARELEHELRGEIDTLTARIAELQNAADERAEEDTATARRIEQLESERDTLRARVLELEADLETAREQPEASAPRPEEDLEALRNELVSFEQLLVEREQAVEAAAQRMRRLEETAVKVQQELIALRDEQDAAADADASETDPALVARLQQQLDEAAAVNADQARRLSEREMLLQERQAELEQLKETVARLSAREEAVAAAPDTVDTRKETAFPFDALDDSGQRRSMGEILVEAGIITQRQLDFALDEQRSAKKRRLGSILVEKGLIREEIVAQVVASQLQLPFVRLPKTEIQRGAVALMDGRLATHHMCFPIAATSDEITVAMANPLDLIAIEDLEFATHLKVKPVVATLSDITSAIVEHYGVTIANALAEDTFDVQSPVQPPQEHPAPRDNG